MGLFRKDIKSLLSQVPFAVVPGLNWIIELLVYVFRVLLDAVVIVYLLN